MNLHEYQSKQLFANYAIPVSAGSVALTAGEAAGIAADIGGDAWMVKAQVHAGGRGKAGGVKRATSTDEVAALAGQMLGTTLVTGQSGPAGQPVNQVLIEPVTDIATELYLGLIIDRSRRRISIMASRAGGMNIEEVAAKTPERIITVSIDPAAGLQPWQCRRTGFFLGLDGTQIKQLSAIMQALARLFAEKDASLIEINPLVITAAGDLVALDAKINIDDSALYRQPDIELLRDESQEDEKERIARQHDLNYITLDGNIACMVNGAGLAMATMDIIKLHGGEPANFLDVGGGTTAARVAEAFKLILSDDKVQAILVNIFGGIVRCDMIAEGIIGAVGEVGIDIPVVVRLEGTNVEQGRQLLAQSGLAIETAADLEDAARRVVAAAAGS